MLEQHAAEQPQREHHNELVECDAQLYADRGAGAGERGRVDALTLARGLGHCGRARARAGRQRQLAERAGRERHGRNVREHKHERQRQRQLESAFAVVAGPGAGRLDRAHPRRVRALSGGVPLEAHARHQTAERGVRAQKGARREQEATREGRRALQGDPGMLVESYG